MINNRYKKLLLSLSFTMIFSLCAGQKRQHHYVMNDNKRSSISVPNGFDWMFGFFAGTATYLLQNKYIPDAFEKIQKMMPQDTLYGNKNVWTGISYVPTIATAGYIFYKIHRITPSGLYNRSLRIFNDLEQFSCTKRACHSIGDFKDYIISFGTAKEKAELFGNEHQHVVAYKFLSNLLLKLTYAERLLERALSWVQNPVLQAKIESLKFEIVKKTKIVLNNKDIYERAFYNELSAYREDARLSNEDRIADVVEGNHTLEKVKFVFKVASKICKILWVPIKTIIVLPFKASDK